MHAAYTFHGHKVCRGCLNAAIAIALFIINNATKAILSKPDHLWYYPTKALAVVQEKVHRSHRMHKKDFRGHGAIGDHN